MTQGLPKGSIAGIDRLISFSVLWGEGDIVFCELIKGYDEKLHGKY
jgi:hypothetical protein